MAPAPVIAGWLYDLGGDPYPPLIFAAALFGMTAAANALFRVVEARLSG